MPCRDESNIINEFFDVILLEIKPKILDVARYPVGLDSRVKGISTLLSCDTEGVTTIGIYGMGGVGKTTLAKGLYNHLLLEGSFKRSSFLDRVREASRKVNGQVSLQQQFVDDILRNNRTPTFHNVEEGTVIIRMRFKSAKVLVLIDDIDNHEQYEYLIGPFAPGSVVIVTTRDEEILDKIEVEPKYRFKVDMLNVADSQALFSQHAFGNVKPDKTLLVLSKGILSHAGGLPFALEVFGSYLFMKSEVEWRSYIAELQRNPDSSIFQKLIISLNALDSEDPILMQIFVDIACFFIGRKKEDIVRIMETYYCYVDHAIDILKKRCLLNINNRNELEMHNLLCDMGRDVARKNSGKGPGKHSRLWALDDIYDALKKQKVISEYISWFYPT